MGWDAAGGCGYLEGRRRTLLRGEVGAGWNRWAAAAGWLWIGRGVTAMARGAEGFMSRCEG